MNKIKLTDSVKNGFLGEIHFFSKGTEFGVIKIKEALKGEIALYVFLFKIMEDSFKDQPELKMHKFGEIFEASMAVNGKEITEKKIMETFGNSFTVKFKKPKKHEKKTFIK